jgi:hypothetical protein
MSCHKCFRAAIRTTLQKCGAQRIDSERVRLSFLRQEVATFWRKSRFFVDLPKLGRPKVAGQISADEVLLGGRE